MQLPPPFIHSLRDLPGFDEAAFVAVHQSDVQVTSVRINPRKIAAPAFQTGYEPVPWTDLGYYLASRPSFTFDPLFHAGCYYVQEASSMFLEQALRQTVDLTKPLKVLDLCAAPGGKTTHIQSLLSKDSLLVSNEVIRSRAAVLKDNIIKWGAPNIAVTNNDPADFAALPGFFDVVVVDAPCSGSGLFRRDETAITEWSEHSVALCSQRQQRILADILPALREGGLLVYSTCSYSKEEDEDILKWLGTEMELEGVALDPEPGWNVVTVKEGSDFGYRFWPHLLRGEGFFMSVFRKKGAAGRPEKYRMKQKPLSVKETGVLARWISTAERQFVIFGGRIYAWPDALCEALDLLAGKMKVVYSGVLVGELVRDKLIPDHALALSGLTPDTVARAALSREEAIRYLQRKELVLEATQKGWQLAVFAGHPLGWMNVLPNRVNNYYPRELRILKERAPGE
ncbi:methyltransferase RsmF C-terminal domain-like protein [Niabella drilacis]|uniref:16S rRNA C967 or C1407 C5-methylase, RsmB/RsmF family n=1 Tax=Niabella drilacis (strain DSM 25811 / CCM 8410 / CCUG 62505 / LMG 26954 / E90) TaxID=1285928 RepID=A0A1G6U2H9_NIADE|nr:RsmF rRNA methyltransferase first C-terminal domain-containing protein [Niabella drilacis]SDD34755.1 16S rRNA C967 or C1407 C5-methylase, RsmB/RsmF family [Niabella drilacis]